MENVEFMDAVKILAERANLPMPKTNFDNQQTIEAKRKKDAVLKILNETAHFYLNTLNSGKADNLSITYCFAKYLRIWCESLAWARA